MSLDCSYLAKLCRCTRASVDRNRLHVNAGKSVRATHCQCHEGDAAADRLIPPQRHCGFRISATRLGNAFESVTGPVSTSKSAKRPLGDAVGFSAFAKESSEVGTYVQKIKEVAHHGM